MGLGSRVPVGLFREVSKWAPGKALGPLGCSHLWWLGLMGLPLPETDCLLLFLHLAGIMSVFHCVICCLIATCKPPFLFCFLLKRCLQNPVSHVGSQSMSAGNPALGGFLLRRVGPCSEENPQSCSPGSSEPTGSCVATALLQQR